MILFCFVPKKLEIFSEFHKSYKENLGETLNCVASTKCKCFKAISSRNTGFFEHSTNQRPCYLRATYFITSYFLKRSWTSSSTPLSKWKQSYRVQCIFIMHVLLFFSNIEGSGGGWGVGYELNLDRVVMAQLRLV